MHRSRRSLRVVTALAVCLAATVTGGTTAFGSPSAQPMSAGDPPLSRPDEESARAAALATGRRVEVSGLRSETRQVFANPTGTFTLEQYVRPVRVNRGGVWVAVDTTLGRTADGRVAPAAVALDLTFSGGGGGALVRLVRAGKELALSWPGPLPAPVLDGDVATYREVLPGVDLVVRADVEGYAETLVVKSAEAAANPALAELRFGLQTRNLTVRQDAGGNLDMIDGSGGVVFHGPAPSMWDSSGVVADRRELLSGPGQGAKLRAMGMSVQPGGLVLTPDRSMLTDPRTRWPVFIDPFATGTRAAWTSVWKAHPTTSYYNSSDIARVGHESETGMTNRSFFAMDTSKVRGKHILKGTFRAYETWAWSCNARAVELWRTGGISSSTTWNNQPSWSSKLTTVTVAKGWSSSCPAGGVDFNATSAVVTAAAKGWTRLTLGLRASDETDTFAWKKFKNNPSLEIEYNTVPNVPSNTTTDPGLPCVTGSSRPVIGTSTATFRAKITDADPQNVGARFEWWHTGGSIIASKVTAKVASGTIHSATTGTLSAGTYSWRVRAEDGTDVSAWHSWCEFTVDLTAPQKPPIITSTIYPETKPGEDPVFGGGVGVSDTFTFAPGAGDTDVKAYRYGLNEFPPSTQVAAGGTGATASVTITPTIDLLNRLFVRSVDAAGNLGPIYGYEFYVIAPPRLPGTAVSTWQGLPGPYYNLDELITVSDYTPGSQQRWSYRYNFVNTTNTGLLGLEVDGETRTAFFTVIGATAGLATADGASCTPMTPLIAYHCQLDYDWVPGRAYRLRTWVLELDSNNNQWWGAWVQDTETEEDTFIGKVRMSHTQRLAAPVSQAEYTGPDFGACEFLPQSKALMDRITANAGTVTATGATLSIDGGLGCPGTARIAMGPVGSVAEIGQVPLYTSCEEQPQTYLVSPGATTTSGTKVAEISAWRTDDGAPAQIWSLNPSYGNTNQRWTPQCQPDGTFVFVNVNSGKCLTEPSSGDGVNLVQQTCTYGDNQRWWHDYRGTDALGRDYWTLINALDLRCMDIEGKGWTNGVPVQVWTCAGVWNQLFWFWATSGVERNLLENGSFERNSLQGWSLENGVSAQTYQDSTSVDGAVLADVVNTNTVAVGLRQDVTLPAASKAGDSYVASVWVRCKLCTNAGSLVLYGLGGTVEVAEENFTATDTWTQVRVPLDTTTDGHTSLSLRVRGQPGMHLIADGALLLRNLLANGSFERNSLQGWSLEDGVSAQTYQDGTSVDGAVLAEVVNSNTVNAGLRQDVVLPAASKAGDSYVASVWVRCKLCTNAGSLVLYGLGGTVEVAEENFAATDTWTQVRVPLDTTTDGHTSLSLRVRGEAGLHLMVDGALVTGT